jgi:hypothetical protein
MPGGWQGSNRHAELPANWPAIRAVVLTRDGHQCTWLDDHHDADGGYTDYLAGNYQPHQRCTTQGHDVDHVGNPHDHSVTNCRTLCDQHHDKRSSRQGNTQRARLRAQLRLPKASHPGLS